MNRLLLFSGARVQILLAIVFPAFLTVLPAQEEKKNFAPLSSSQVEAIKKHLETLRESREQQKLGTYGDVLRKLQSAAGSESQARDLYVECFKKLNFSEQLNARDSDFREWKQENDEALDFEPFTDAVRLQLEYLVLTVRASQADDLAVVVSDLMNYARKIVSLEEPLHPYLDSGVDDSVFAEAFELDEALGGDEGWEYNPLQIGQMYEKTVFPYLRESNPAKLDSAWSTRIQQETALMRRYLEAWKEMERYLDRNRDQAGRNRNRDDDPALITSYNRRPSVQQELSRMARFAYQEAKLAERFQRERLPMLRWGQLVDQYKYGPDPATAARSMIDLIEENLVHDQADAWMAQLEALTEGTDPGEAASAG